MGKTTNKTVILGMVIAAVFILGILTIDLASADHPQKAGYRFTQFVEDLASHFPVTSADIVDGTIQGVDIATDAVVTIANLIVTGDTTLQGDAHVVAGKSLFVDTIEPESESFVLVPGGLEVLGISGFGIAHARWRCAEANAGSSSIAFLSKTSAASFLSWPPRCSASRSSSACE